MERQNTHTLRRVKVWHGIVALLLILVGWFVVFRISVHHKLKQRLQALRAEGYPVTLKELDRSYRLPEGAENAADFYLTAFSYCARWHADSLTDLPFLGSASLPARTQPLDAPTQQLAEKFLSDHGKTLSLLHEAASIEHCRYPIDSTQGGWDMLTPWLKDCRTSTRLLCLEALVQCENQDPGQALESVRASLALAGSLNVPALVQRLVQIALRGLAYSTVERVFNRVPLTEEQLLSLSEWIEPSETGQGYQRAMVGERCFGLHAFQAPTGRISGETGSGSGLLNLLIVPRKILGLHDRDMLGYVDLMQDHIDAVALPDHKRLAVYDSIQEAVNKGERAGLLTRMLMPALARTLQLDVRCTAHGRAVQTALAVERYRLAEGRLPQSLDDLVPAYIEAVPTDPFDGQDMRYRTLDAGFVVYSVGEDLTDDGGTERDKRPKRGPRGEPLPWDVTFVVER